MLALMRAVIPKAKRVSYEKLFDDFSEWITPMALRPDLVNPENSTKSLAERKREHPLCKPNHGVSALHEKNQSI